MSDAVVVCGVARNAAGLVLIEQRTKGEYRGRWDLPGGKVQAGETHQAALAREWMEELGVRVQVGALLATRPGLAPAGYTLWFYQCAIIQGTPTPRDGQDLAWIGLPDLGRYALLPQDHAVLVECVFTTISPGHADLRHL